jgi:hypothetical protein
MFEDVEPAAVLDERENEDAQQELLVKFPDEDEVWHCRKPFEHLGTLSTELVLNSLQPVWMPAKYVSEEVVEDYKSGLEYAEAECIIDVRNRGDSRTYLVK